MLSCLKLRHNIIDENRTVMQTLQANLISEIAEISEVQLLLCCARTNISDTASRKIITLLQKDLDWTLLIRAANWHGVTPLLYRNIINTCPNAIYVPQQLRTYFYANALNNELLIQELLNLLNLFDRYKISVIPFKGPVAAKLIYGDVALREFSDLDFLIQQRDLPEIKRLLISQGYVYPPLQNTHGNECHFVHPITGINLDIHWRLTPQFFRFPLGFEELQSRLQSVMLSGQSVPSVSPEDLILILSAEWVRDCCHQRSHLIQLSNLAELIRNQPTLNWPWILDRAHKLGSERMLLLSLAVTSALLDVALPEPVLYHLKVHGIVYSLAQEANSYLWWQVTTGFILAESIPASFPHFGNKQQFILKIRERLSDSLIYYFYCVLAPSSKEKVILPLPEALTFFYLPIRLARLSYKHGLQQFAKLIKH